MPRFRLYPTPAQEAVMVGHCTHARFVWNLALEQQLWWRPDRGRAPGYAEQNRQLTEARAVFPWLSAGSRMVQKQALRDADQAWRNFFGGTHRQPTWRRAGKHEGFRVCGADYATLRRLNRRWSSVLIPKVGWVRYRRTRAEGAFKSYRVTLDRAGRWHIAFTVIPGPIPAPGNGEVVGVDRGVTVAAALSTGELLSPARADWAGLARAQRRLSRAQRGSARRLRVKAQVARLRARDADRRKDWAEKLGTRLAREFDLIRVEDLRIGNMIRSARGTVAEPGKNVRQKAGLNRGILSSGWGLLVRRLEDKAPGRVERVNAAFTSQRCSGCGHTAPGNRESQAVFRCESCHLTLNADVNAARNIAAGHAVTARGGWALARPLNREPQRT